jgi:DNA topoisomerase-1
MTKQTLIIVESPTKAHSIQKYAGDDYKVVASKGHIEDLGKGKHLGIGVDVEKDFRPRYVIMDDQVDTVKMLIREAEKADKILLCGDPDREGEAISQSLYSRLKDLKKPMKRITMHEITKKGVQEALANPRDIDAQLVASQEARRILDRLVGFMASPFLMNYFGKNLSAGRVQSVVARMIVDREKEIDEFKPEEYWVIQANLANLKKEAFIAKYDGRPANKEAATKIKDELLADSERFIVKSVEAAEEKKKAPPPLITAKLQQVMSKGFNISADRTMKIAQSLYERSFITYMRTDSVRANPDAIKEVRAYIKEQGYEVPKTANVFKNKDAAQDGHECIRPTDLTITLKSGELSGEEATVYGVIHQHFMASQMMPAIYNTLKVVVEATTSKHLLKAGGKAIKSKGYLELFNVDNGQIDIPNLSKGDAIVLNGKEPVSAEQKFTQPPPRYSEANLIETLEKKNIGRPSTFADLIAKITARNYVEKQGNTFHPTALGKTITNELIKSFTFMNYDYTALLEDKLDLIATGKLDRTKMLSDFYTPFKLELNKAYVSHGAKECNKCGSPMLERTGKSGSFWGCSTWPRCSNTKSIDIKPSTTSEATI